MKSLLLTGVVIYLGVGLFLYLQQRSFIYLPVPESSHPHPVRWFENDGHRLKVFVQPGKGQERGGAESGGPALIYFGGNAEAVEHNIDDFAEHLPEYTAYLVNYRGYGGSDGRPTEHALYADALALFDELKQQHASIVVIGRSLGSAVATHTAASRSVDKLVLVTPFDSVLSVAQAQYPIYPASVMLKDRHDSLSRAGDIRAPTLVLAAEQDRVIKMKHTRRLVEGFDIDVAFHVLDGVGHNNISLNPAYYQLLDDFL